MIHVYDVMDKVMVVAMVWDSELRKLDTKGAVLNSAVTVQGQGLDNPAQWLQEAVIPLLEEL